MCVCVSVYVLCVRWGASIPKSSFVLHWEVCACFSRVAFQDFDNWQVAAALTKIHSMVTSSGLEIRAVSPQPSNKVQINLESKNVTASSLPIVASQLRALVREELGLNFTFEYVFVNYTGEGISSAETLRPLLALLPCVFIFLSFM